MKRSALLFIVSFFVCSFVVPAFAEEQDMQDQPQGGEYRDQQEGGHQGGGMKGGKGMMKGMGMRPTLIATSDGGVVILEGNRLTKYDSVLNLVQEVELKKGKKGPEPMDHKDMPQEEQLPPPVKPPTLDNAPAAPDAAAETGTPS